jgi:hypothetical protein
MSERIIVSVSRPEAIPPKENIPWTFICRHLVLSSEG